MIQTIFLHLILNETGVPFSAYNTTFDSAVYKIYNHKVFSHFFREKSSFGKICMLKAFHKTSVHKRAIVKLSLLHSNVNTQKLKYTETSIHRNVTTQKCIFFLLNFVVFNILLSIPLIPLLPLIAGNMVISHNQWKWL